MEVTGVRALRLPVVLATLLIGGVAGCADNIQGAAPAASVSPAAPSAAGPASVPAATGAATATAAASVTATATAAPVGKAFPLTVTRRGGFAGVDDRVVIAADGSAVVTHRGKAPVRTSLSAGTMAELRQLLTAPEFTGRRTPSASPAVCADGFEYEIVSASVATAVHGCDAAHAIAQNPVLTLVAGLFQA
ncbi:hypothetical protein GCM10023107_55220 [Actinoplanes octamycinicus]|nr:hypothetical protein Aoc01nite_88940 [Actinoplanes octamycinicus]